MAAFVGMRKSHLPCSLLKMLNRSVFTTVTTRSVHNTKRTSSVLGNSESSPVVNICRKAGSFGSNRCLHSATRYHCIRSMSGDSCIFSWQLHRARNIVFIRGLKKETDLEKRTAKSLNQSTLNLKSSIEQTRDDKKDTSTLYYMGSVVVLMIGLTFSFVPLFKRFCQEFGLGGDPKLSKTHDPSRVEHLKKLEEREIYVTFEADTRAMVWDFKPQQKKIVLNPGETALAFYSAQNPTNEPVIGISTYNIWPPQAAQYFNKIQCFCFEEQMLNPHEQVDMPVFFFIDPAYDDDPNLENINEITLSYTFFQAKPGLNLPVPSFLQGKPNNAPTIAG